MLFVDGTAGGPSRSAVLLAFAAFTISVVAPPANPPGTAYALWVTVGGASPATLPFSVGTMCFTPLPLASPGAPTLPLADGIGFGVPAVFPAAPAPASFPIPGGVPVPISTLIQGVIFDAAEALPVLRDERGRPDRRLRACVPRAARYPVRSASWEAESQRRWETGDG